MYTIEVEKECGCFKKSGFEKVTTFETKEEAMMRAKVMECRMNQEFCFKHYFDAVDHGDKIIIHSTLRPEDEDDDAPDIKELMARNHVAVHFNAEEETPHGGSCSTPEPSQ